jgi:dTDP-4-dehydrorhamnose reductase
MELWAGVECTVNRVGDRYLDQLERSGHAQRFDDLERFAALGISAIRYPVLWERTAPDGLACAAWDWADRRLERLRELGIEPIVGLVHHGSGPRCTDLLDPDFPEQLAEFAHAVARRHPWIGAYTPVNEPLTTARFSALYGHWYPHHRDDRSFARALVTQCRAVVRAMQAIRSVNPSARLIQTEDAGTVFSTPRLAYQAQFENQRRWLGLDLLAGTVGADHPLAGYLARSGIGDAELEELARADCPPDAIGVNYYLTSDRLLDERTERYPSWSHGGNGRHAYADVPAVHAWRGGITGFRHCLVELWRRYRIPVCITEAHLGCTREEQMRWLMEAWEGARAAQSDGADVRAVTVWSLLGSYDWNRLVTEEGGFYESGVFDVRGPVPRATALAPMMRSLAARGSFEHPLLGAPGWWQRPTRLRFPPVGVSQTAPLDARPCSAVRAPRRPLVIAGAGGTLGSAFARLCPARGIEHVALSRSELDIAHPEAIDRLLEDLRPWALVNTAGYVRVDDAEADRERCVRENTLGAGHLAEACGRHGVKLLTYSSDLVFDGSRTDPYLESHPVSPLNVYGESKAEAERRVSEVLPSALIIRTSAFFGPWDSYNFVSHVFRQLGEGRKLRVASTVVSPTYVPELVHASLDLLIDDERGIWHVANQGAVSWSEWARTAALLASFDASLVEACEPADLGWAAARPSYSALGSERGRLLPAWEESLGRYLAEREQRA